MSSFSGKTVLINIWALWCVPCREEHHYLQKLYDQIKDRRDIQVLTFNIDSEVGRVAPYMKENGYTFPVLLAKEYVSTLSLIPAYPATGSLVRKGTGYGKRLISTLKNGQNRVLQRIEESTPKPCAPQQPK